MKVFPAPLKQITMKKKIISAIAVLSASLGLNAQIPVVSFLNTHGGSTNFSVGSQESDAIKGIAEDANSNTYVIGNYSGSIHFDQWNYSATTGLATTPITGGANYNSAGGQDVFLARYDISGKCTWSASIGGTGFDEGNAICLGTGSPLSEFFITGTFTESMTIGTTTLTVTYPGANPANADAFIIRYATALGSNPTLGWARRLGGGAETNGKGIAATSSNVFITGYYTEFIDHPTAGTIEVQKTHIGGGGGFATSSAGYLEFPDRDMFIARYSTSGTYSDAINTYGSEDQVEAHGIALYGTDIYVTGFYKDNVSFTGSTISCSGHCDVFTARYPQNFTMGSTQYAAAYAATAGGSSTVYQWDVNQPFWKPDNSNGIVVNAQGVFITGTFMDETTFGSTNYNPSGSTTQSYMFLTRYSLTLTSPLVVTGSNNFSEGYGIYGVSYMGTSYCFVTGAAASNSMINGTSVETNSNPTESVGYMARIAYNSTTNAFTNNFVDGLGRNANYLDGTGANDINVVGYAISYRVGCGVRAGGKFSSKTFFGNWTGTASGTNDAFLMDRENSTTITSNMFECGTGSIVLTGTYTGAGTPSYTWTQLPSTVVSTTTTATVTPVSNATTTYQYQVSGSGTCPSTSIVTVDNYPASSSASAGPDQHICETTHSVVIGSPALNGATYSWSPSGSLNNATYAQPTATVSSNTTYTMTCTDKCGNVSTDQVVVYYTSTCARRTMSPEAAAMLEDGDVSVYPNPNNGSFTVDVHSTASKNVYVYDAMGKLVFSMDQTAENIIPVDLSTQPDGIYMIRVVTADSVVTEKIIKQ